MAKRFTDTAKWKDDWFQALPVKMKCAWQYICDECDGVGVWKVNLSPLSWAIGESVTREDLDQYFGSRVHWLSPSRLWIRAFIPFQYKTLSPKIPAHRNMMKQIYEMGRDLPLTDDLVELIRRFEAHSSVSPESALIERSVSPDPALDQKETGKRKQEIGNRKEENTGSKTNAALEIPHLAACKQTWLETLKHFGQPRERILRDEEVIIARAVQDNGAETVDLALYGARHEPSHDGWDPRAHVDIARVLTKDKEGKPRIQKFVGYGIKAREKEKQLAATRVQIEQARQVHGEADEPPHADPERVRAMIRNIGRASSMPAGGFV